MQGGKDGVVGGHRTPHRLVMVEVHRPLQSAAAQHRACARRPSVSHRTPCHAQGGRSAWRDDVEPRIARRAAVAALLAGIGADILFDRTGLGINVPLATVAALAAVTWFGARHRPADPLDLWLPATALAGSLGPAIRTDPTVLPLDIVLVLAGTTAWGLAVSGVAVTRRSAAAVALLRAFAGTVTVVALAWLVARSGADGFFSRGLGQLGRLAPVVRGGLI